MPRIALTARTVAALKADQGQVDYWDKSLAGFGLRVSPTKKVWTIFYRQKGRVRRHTLGRYPDLSLADARVVARKALHRTALGADPGAEKQTERGTYGDTVKALVDLYERKAKQKRSWPEERRILQNIVLPAWEHRLVKDIRRRDVRELVEAKAEKAPVMANRLLSRISRLFNFAMDHEWIDANPAARLTKPGAEHSRDRVLTRDEVRELWPALHETEVRDAAGELVKDDEGNPIPRLSKTLNDAFVVMLLTAQRMGEVCGMRWDDVNLEAGWWTIPGTDTKNQDSHRVPLTKDVVDILKRRKETAKPDAIYVFSNRKGTSVADRAKKAASTLSQGLSFSFRAHDLRRTAASRMAEAGVRREHIAHVLNHRSVTKSSVTAIYDRYSYDAEKRTALTTWAQVLTKILEEKQSARVLAMPAR